MREALREVLSKTAVRRFLASVLVVFNLTVTDCLCSGKAFYHWSCIQGSWRSQSCAVSGEQNKVKIEGPYNRATPMPPLQNTLISTQSYKG